VIDCGSIVHIAKDQGEFVKYRKLDEEHMIAGIGGPPLTAVGIGEVLLLCKVPEGIKPVRLTEVWHVPEARANLFSQRKATDAGAEVISRKGTSLILRGGKVDVQAVQCKGLLVIETVGKHEGSPMAEQTVRNGSVVGEDEEFKKAANTEGVAVFEIDLDESDDESEENAMQTEQLTKVTPMAAEVVGAVQEFVAPEAQTPAAESVGAAGAKKAGVQTRAQLQAARSVGGTDEVDMTLGNGSDGARQSPEGRRYPERQRRETYETSEPANENIWVTPRSKKKQANISRAAE
jgi:hypothetical protein